VGRGGGGGGGGGGRGGGRGGFGWGGLVIFPPPQTGSRRGKAFDMSQKNGNSSFTAEGQDKIGRLKTCPKRRRTGEKFYWSSLGAKDALSRWGFLGVVLGIDWQGGAGR